MLNADTMVARMNALPDFEARYSFAPRLLTTAGALTSAHHLRAQLTQENYWRQHAVSLHPAVAALPSCEDFSRRTIKAVLLL